MCGRSEAGRDGREKDGFITVGIYSGNESGGCEGRIGLGSGGAGKDNCKGRDNEWRWNDELDNRQFDDYVERLFDPARKRVEKPRPDAADGSECLHLAIGGRQQFATADSDQPGVDIV